MLPATTRWPLTGEWLMRCSPTIPTRYVHVLAGAGDPTLEIKAGGPISAFVEAAGEATKTGSGSSQPDPESPCAIRRDRSDCPIFFAIGIRSPHTYVMVLPFRFAKSQLYVERSCVDEDCIMGPKKRKGTDFGKRCV